ncbi:MAG: hypothetical protein JJD97_10745 [Gemmatimonadaceae bacterium]|nr:hypothetical protein [Gemmatimonadaceae bacterium]
MLRSHATAPVDTGQRASARTTEAKASAPYAAAALSASEVTRLTEHVLRTMDRRISAFRERQGRS